MISLVALLLAADGGGVPVDYRGTLEAKATYVLKGEHDPARGLDLLAALRPPALKLPMHHAARVEWADPGAIAALPRGALRLEFVVEAVDVVRMSEGRWNTTYRCRLVRAEPDGAPMAMESYQLVLLVRPPDWKPLPDAEAEAIQAKHLAYLDELAKSGKLVLAGPFADQKDVTLRGACIYRAGSIDEARRLAEADPAVQAKRLRVEAVTWWVGKGYVAFPKAPKQP